MNEEKRLTRFRRLAARQDRMIRRLAASLESVTDNRDTLREMLQAEQQAVLDLKDRLGRSSLLNRDKEREAVYQTRARELSYQLDYANAELDKIADALKGLSFNRIDMATAVTVFRQQAVAYRAALKAIRDNPEEAVKLASEALG